MEKRTIDNIVTNPLRPGFLGKGHMASAVLDGQHFSKRDPFILLMDDQLDLPGGKPVGGAHPHAGFETVTFVLEGDGKDWKAGSLELMTAGKGIVHTEEITAKTRVRILQLWLALSPEKRWAEPFWQELLLEQVPVHREESGEIRVYSGSSHGLTSPLQNRTPFMLLDLHLKAGGKLSVEIPSKHNGFMYVIEGNVNVGGKILGAGQTGWLNKAGTDGNTQLDLCASDSDARVVLYTATPHGAAIVSHGPFIGDTQEDIVRLYKEYRQGQMPHLRDLPQERKVRHGKVA